MGNLLIYLIFLIIYHRFLCNRNHEIVYLYLVFLKIILANHIILNLVLIFTIIMDYFNWELYLMLIMIFHFTHFK